jgi:hypothetical protein
MIKWSKYQPCISKYVHSALLQLSVQNPHDPVTKVPNSKNVHIAIQGSSASSKHVDPIIFALYLGFYQQFFTKDIGMKQANCFFLKFNSSFENRNTSPKNRGDE